MSGMGFQAQIVLKSCFLVFHSSPLLLITALADPGTHGTCGEGGGHWWSPKGLEWPLLQTMTLSTPGLEDRANCTTPRRGLRLVRGG